MYILSIKNTCGGNEAITNKIRMKTQSRNGLILQPAYDKVFLPKRVRSIPGRQDRK